MIITKNIKYEGHSDAQNLMDACGDIRIQFWGAIVKGFSLNGELYYQKLL